MATRGPENGWRGPERGNHRLLGTWSKHSVESADKENGKEAKTESFQLVVHKTLKDNVVGNERDETHLNVKVEAGEIDKEKYAEL